MASIIKNQIIKHLSKFTKNLSQDKIGLSTLKGEGSLSNLELDEEVLMDVLELPSWIVITKAVCNRVNVKIPWTKLKTHPICMYLDEVVLEMRTVRDLRPLNTAASKFQQQTSSGPSKYGYVEKVLDGMYVHVNNISGTFVSDTFRGDIQISQLLLQSTTPDWKPSNLRATRLTLQEEGEVITFKQVEWSTVRIIIDANDTKLSGTSSTPIRLITNQGHVRIAIKKRISDCGLVASKLQVLLDDILLVLTDSQLKAVILHFRSLSPVIQKATAQSKARAAEKAQTSGAKSAQDITIKLNQPNRTSTEIQFLQIVKKHDIFETSYHFVTRHVDLHLCDELNRKDTGTPEKRIEGGSMQVSLQGFSLDYYPYHSAGSTRNHWKFFDEAFETSESWMHSLLAHFKQQYASARREIDKIQKEKDEKPSAPPVATRTGQSSPTKSPNRSPVHAKPVVTTKSSAPRAEVKGQEVRYKPTGQPPQQPQKQQPPAQPTRQPQQPQKTQASPAKKPVRLMSHCMIIRVQGFKFSSVATAVKRSDQDAKCLIMSDKKTFCLPEDVPSIHVEYTSFYFPNELDFPVPSPMTYIQCNPLVFNVDTMTILWLNQFAFNILQTLPDLDDFTPTTQMNGQDHIDIRLDALMPKIIIPGDPDHVREDQPDRPQQLQIQMSKLTATNCRIGNALDRPALSKLLQGLNKQKIAMDRTAFPGAEGDILLVPRLFWKHAFEPNFFVPDVINAYRENRSIGNGAIPQTSPGGVTAPPHLPKLTTFSFRQDSVNDIWGVDIDQIWAEFTGVPSSLDRPVPFIEPIPIRLWLSWPPKENNSKEDNSTTAVGYNSKDNNSTTSSPSKKTNAKRKEKEVLADLHGLLEMSHPLHVILNHYQFLFLMRVQNALKMLADDMEKDQLLFSEKARPISSQVVAVDCPSLQVTLLLPEEPAADPSEGSQTGRVGSEKVSDCGETDNKNGTLGREKDARGSGNSLDVDHPQEQIHRSYSEASSLAAKDVPSSRRSTSPSLVRPPSPLLRQSTPPLHASATVPAMLPSSGLSSAGSATLLDVRQGAADGRGANSAEDLSAGSRSASHVSLNSISSSVQLSALLMKNNSSTSLDELESKEDFDLVSVDSDSSDGFSLVNRRGLGGSLQDMESESGFGSEFSTAGQVDNKANSGEDTTNPVAEVDYSDNIFKLKKVSLVRGLLHNVSMGVIMVGKDLSVKAEVQSVGKTEEGNTDFNNFMSKFDSGDAKGIVDIPLTEGTSSDAVIALRFDSGPSAEKLCETAEDRGYVQFKARNVNLDVLQTTITHISGLVNDEIKAPPMPISIWVEQSKFNLLDNVPSAFPTFEEVNPQLPLNVPFLHVFRSPDGVFHLKSKSDQTKEESESMSAISRAKALDGSRENEQLKQRLKMMEDAMEVLEHERISLMGTLEHLQEELLSSDRKKDELLFKLNELRRKVELGK